MAVPGRRLPTLLFLFVLLAPLAHAGSAEDPELTDPEGDVDDGIPGTDYTGIDVVKAWVDGENATHVRVKVQTVGDIEEGTQQEFTFKVRIFHAGTEQLVSFSIGEDSAVASVDGNVLSVVYAKGAFSGLRPGDLLEGLSVEADGTTGGLASSASEDAPDDDAGPARVYVVGSQADAGVDYDGDGLDDRDELRGGTDPSRADPDLDGLDDAEELALGTDPNDDDSDDDGLNDGDEVDLGTDPLSADSDGDGLDDGAERNEHGSDPLSPDSDNDGVPDAEEVTQGTDPANEDTDGDGVDDKTELERDRLDPRDGSDGRADPDGDGVSTADELAAGTDPFVSDLAEGGGALAGEGPGGLPWWLLAVLAAVVLLLVVLLFVLLARRRREPEEEYLEEPPEPIHEVEEVSELDDDEAPFVLSEEYLREGLTDEEVEAARERFLRREKRFWDTSSPARDRSHDPEDLDAPWTYHEAEERRPRRLWGRGDARAGDDSEE